MTLFVPRSHFLLESRLLGCVTFTSEQSIVIVARPFLLYRELSNGITVCADEATNLSRLEQELQTWGGHEPSRCVKGKTPKLGQDVISSLAVVVPSSREWRELSFDTFRNLSATWTNMASSGLLNRHIYTVKILYTH